MPACPNPALPTSLRIQTLNYVMVVFIPSFTVGVACNGRPSSPTSPQAHFDGPPRTSRSRPGHTTSRSHT